MSKYEARVLPIVEQYRSAHDEGEDMATVIADMVADLLHLLAVEEREVVLDRARSYLEADADLECGDCGTELHDDDGVSYCPKCFDPSDESPLSWGDLARRGW